MTYPYDEGSLGVKFRNIFAVVHIRRVKHSYLQWQIKKEKNLILLIILHLHKH